MSDRIEVCAVEELGPGERTIVEDGEVSIGVFNVEGEYYAVLNSCQHQYGPVCEGQLMPEIEAEQGEQGRHVEERLSESHHVLRCPWHGWTYDVRTGDHTGDRDIALPTFDVVAEDGTLYVE